MRCGGTKIHKFHFNSLGFYLAVSPRGVTAQGNREVDLLNQKGSFSSASPETSNTSIKMGYSRWNNAESGKAEFSLIRVRKYLQTYKKIL